MPERTYGLGRLVEHDGRSLAYDIARTVPQEIKPVEWQRHSPILDQGDLGSCTGNAMAGWLACEPHCTSDAEGADLDEQAAVDLYSAATRVDIWPGQWPPDDTGSSGNAVAKAAREMGYITRWSWAFSGLSMLRALQLGPVIVGVPWYESMFDPDVAGTVEPHGDIVGGHEFLVRGWNGRYLLADNSWTASWGRDGSFRFNTLTWETLRKNRADVTVPHI
jgi:hypothetical protein